MGRESSGVEIRKTSIRVVFYIDGERIRERITVNGQSLQPTPANIKYANQLAATVRKRIELGTFQYAEFFPDSPRANAESPDSFGALAKLWLQSKGTLKDGTKYHYETAVNKWLAIFGSTTPIDKLTYAHIAAKIGGHPWASPKHANNCLVALRGIMSMHYAGKRSVDNPMAGIGNLKVVKKPPDPFTEDERDAILAHLKKQYDVRVWAYYCFQFYTGCRPEETIAFDWADLNEQTNEIRVQRVRTFRGGERDGSKTDDTRDVYLVAPALEAIAAMKQYTYLKGGRIFENPVTGKPWHDERAQRRAYFNPTLKALGIRQRRAYNTRHTYATVALMRGVKPAYIASQMGHANTRMLFEKYARWIEDADKGAERRAMDAAMNAPKLTQRKGGTT